MAVTGNSSPITYTDPLTVGATYRFDVRAVNQQGTSGASNQSALITIPQQAVPAGDLVYTDSLVYTSTLTL